MKEFNVTIRVHETPPGYRIVNLRIQESGAGTDWAVSAGDQMVDDPVGLVCSRLCDHIKERMGAEASNKGERGVENVMLNEFARKIHENSINKGWWDEPRSFGDIVALCHSELSEALEEYRNGKPLYYVEGLKPEGIAVEMADCIIRILDWCGKEDVDIASILREKHEFNKSRPYRHGGKAL